MAATARRRSLRFENVWPRTIDIYRERKRGLFWFSHTLSKFGEKSQGTKLHIMPFVLMCGFPSSGKSTRAEQLRQHITETTKRTVLIVGDETIGIDKNDVYAGSILFQHNFISISLFSNTHSRSAYNMIVSKILSYAIIMCFVSISDSRKEKEARATLKSAVQR